MYLPAPAGAAGLNRSVCVEARSRNSIQVADWISVVDRVEEIKELGAQFDVLRFSDAKALDDREINVGLAWTAQQVARDVAKVGSNCSGGCGTIRTRNSRTRSDDRPRKGERIEVVTGGNIT